MAVGIFQLIIVGSGSYGRGQVFKSNKPLPVPIGVRKPE